MAAPLVFSLPNGMVELNAEDVALVLTELDAMAAAPWEPRPASATIAEQLAIDLRAQLDSVETGVLELRSQVPRTRVFLRVLEHLQSSPGPKPLHELRSKLTELAGRGAVYQNVHDLISGRDEPHLRSFSGEYELGDRLVAPDGRTRLVLDVTEDGTLVLQEWPR